MSVKDKPELDTILPPEGTATVGGIVCRVRRLRLRELIMLTRVITRGMGPNLANVDLSGDDKEAAGVALLVMSIPEAFDETIEFLKFITEAVDPNNRSQLAVELDNPDLESVIDLITVVVDQEWSDMQKLWGKVRALWVAKQQEFRTGR